MTETLTDPIVPDFGGPDCPTPEAAAAATDSAKAPRKLVIICSKGNLDMAYPGLVLANAALGEGIETHMFFTFWGFDMVTESRMDDLKFTMVGNTAMHLPQAPNLPIPSFMGMIPGMTKMATKMMQGQLEELEIPSVREMLDIITASGGRLWGCRMSFDMNGLTMADLYEGVEDVISATDFMEISEGGQLLFI